MAYFQTDIVDVTDAFNSIDMESQGAPRLSCDSKPLPSDDFKKYFQVKRELGSGAFGVVSLVSPKKDALESIGLDLPDQLVAKKITKLTKDEEERAFLINEIDMMKQHDFRHGVRCYGAFEDADSFTLIMSLAPGEEMFDIITTPTKAERYAKYYYAIALNIVDAVRELHNAGMVHRDIKPENIYIYIDETKPPQDPSCVHVTLLDFAFACSKAKPTTKMCNQLMGTINYILPGLKARASFKTLQIADWWAVGRIFEFMFLRKWLDSAVKEAFPEIEISAGMRKMLRYMNQIHKLHMPQDSRPAIMTDPVLVPFITSSLATAVHEGVTVVPKGGI